MKMLKIPLVVRLFFNERMVRGEESGGNRSGSEGNLSSLSKVLSSDDSRSSSFEKNDS